MEPPSITLAFRVWVLHDTVRPMRPLESQPIVLSDLSGIKDRPWTYPEVREDSGDRGGYSTFCDRSGAEVLIFHKIEAISWLDESSDEGFSDDLRNRLAGQTVAIRAYRAESGNQLGHLDLQRFNESAAFDGPHLKHSDVWCAHGVNVAERSRGRGIASAMYAHALQSGYAVAPSYSIVPEGIELWKRMDPAIEWDDWYGKSRTRQPMLELPENRLETTAGQRQLFEENRSYPGLRTRLWRDPNVLADDAVVRRLLSQLGDQVPMSRKDNRFEGRVLRELARGRNPFWSIVVRYSSVVDIVFQEALSRFWGDSARKISGQLFERVERIVKEDESRFGTIPTPRLLMPLSYR